jgi:hypothetical protein
MARRAGASARGGPACWTTGGSGSAPASWVESAGAGAVVVIRVSTRPERRRSPHRPRLRSGLAGPPLGPPAAERGEGGRLGRFVRAQARARPGSLSPLCARPRSAREAIAVLNGFTVCVPKPAPGPAVSPRSARARARPVKPLLCSMASQCACPSPRPARQSLPALRAPALGPAGPARPASDPPPLGTPPPEVGPDTPARGTTVRAATACPRGDGWWPGGRATVWPGGRVAGQPAGPTTRPDAGPAASRVAWRPGGRPVGPRLAAARAGRPPGEHRSCTIAALTGGRTCGRVGGAGDWRGRGRGPGGVTHAA